ncbi:fimbrillin family protein [Bacteroides timonensis]|uniref:fimbrillin family protein n=1 Tax=Bacteroides timonensis TaxID=1470345 RepID=UPI0004B91A40|nr:fimbrillin family protein [Bacteroides timonensis]
MNRSFILSLSLICLLLPAGGCSDSACISDVETLVPLQPSFSTATASVTRSIVSETGPGDGKVNHIGVFLTRSTDGHTAYAASSDSYTIFTTSDGSTWTGAKTVNLRTEQARLYAWYPAEGGGIPSDSGSTRTIPVSLPAEQTFDGASATACSQADYLYGSANSTAGDATAITVDCNTNSPTIYLQHALTQLVFTIEYKAGRVPDAEYDRVKSISLTGPFRAGTGTMQLNDGTLSALSQSSATLKFSVSAHPQLPGAIGSPEIVAYGLAAPKAATTGSVTVKLILGKADDTVNDRTLTVATDLFNAAWEKGKRYIYHLLLDKNDITLKTVQIKGWTEVPTDPPVIVPPVIE